jgi:hypothetical protein
MLKQDKFNFRQSVMPDGAISFQRQLLERLGVKGITKRAG